MSMPASVLSALDLVRKSRVLDDARLTAFVEELQTADNDTLTPTALFTLMTERALLTQYQATRLAAGRWEGFRVGSYVIRDFLGRGGTGEVYLAEHSLLQKRVAVKVLSGATDADTAARDRFVREARAAAALNHPNIVQVFDVDVEHDPPFLVMEYVEGVSLQAAVATHGAFTTAEAAIVGVQVAQGLEPVAAVGLVHRDIKPANLLIDRKGAVKILDLGIARFTADTNSRPTAASEIIGTLDYLAPEQAEDSSAVDHRADLYGLGATLYFLIAGHPPFPIDNPTRKIEQKRFSDPPPLRALCPGVPIGFSSIVHRLLERDPAARPQTPGEAAALLMEWATQEPDFPARLFRITPASASGENRPDGPESDHLPETQRIRAPLRSAPEPVPPSAEVQSLDVTLVTSPVAPIVAPPEPTAPPPVPPFTPAPNPPRVVISVWVWVCAVVVGLVAASLVLRSIFVDAR